MFEKFDHSLINLCRASALPLARFSLFLVYFWFGVLKLVGTSPANPLVSALLERTLPFVTFDQFIIFLGIVEVIIGILFLFPKAVRIVFPLLVLHLITTVGPLVLLPSVTWQGFLIPTLEGQYIIKNILIVALAVVVFSRTQSPHEVRKI